MITVSVEYYAALREQAGLAAETLTTTASSVGGLYAELRARHGFSLAGELVGAAVDDALVCGDHPLADGDRVAFLPPVSGG